VKELESGERKWTRFSKAMIEIFSCSGLYSSNEWQQQTSPFVFGRIANPPLNYEISPELLVEVS
jgi:hypothetical protein